MNTYSIVHFIDEDTVEAIPSSWFNTKKNICAWPKSCTKPLRLIEKNVLPNNDDFTFFKARVLSHDIGINYSKFYIFY